MSWITWDILWIIKHRSKYFIISRNNFASNEIRNSLPSNIKVNHLTNAGSFEENKHDSKMTLVKIGYEATLEGSSNIILESRTNINHGHTLIHNFAANFCKVTISWTHTQYLTFLKPITKKKNTIDCILTEVFAEYVHKNKQMSWKIWNWMVFCPVFINNNLRGSIHQEALIISVRYLHVLDIFPCACMFHDPLHHDKNNTF